MPGLAHSSPIVWGNRIFVTSAISSDPKATFRPGLYGDGDASEDRSRHQWMVYAFDKRTGTTALGARRARGRAAEKRHIKSTYASSTPATDGRIVVAWFGSHGVHAYDVTGSFLWKVDLGRLDLGAYDIPSLRVGHGELADHLEQPRHPPVRHAGRLVPAGARRGHRRDGLEDRARGAAFVGHADRR